MLLQPFEKITTLVSAESYPTSCIIPIVQGLQSNIKNKRLTTELGVQLKRNILNVIEKRLAWRLKIISTYLYILSINTHCN